MTPISCVLCRSAVIAVLALVSPATVRAADEPQRTVTLDVGEDINHAIDGHTGLVCAVAYAPDGQTLATAGRDLTVRVWRADTRECKLVLRGHAAGEPVWGYAWEWDADRTTRHPDVPSVAGVWGLAFHPGGDVLASAGADGTVRLWDVKSGTELRSLTGHKRDVRAVAYRPDGKALASAGRDGTVRVWDPTTGKATAALAANHGPVAAVAFSPDGKLIASGCWEGAVDLWDAASGRHVATLNGLDRVQTLAFSPDGKTLAAGGEWNVGIRRWDVANHQRLETIRGNGRGVRALAYSSDGKVLAAADLSGTVRLWSPSGECLYSFGGWGAVRSMSFRPDGKVFAISGNNLVELRDPSGKKPVERLPGSREAVNRKAPSCIGLRPDGKAAATGDAAGAVRLWDATTGKCTAELGRHDAAVVAVRFSPDGKVLVSLDADEGVRVWDAVAGKALVMLREPQAAARERRPLNGFSYLANRRLAVGPAGSPVAVCDGKAVRVWDASGKPLRTFEHPSHVTEIAVSSDGKTLAVVHPKVPPPEGVKLSDPSTVVVYDLSTGARIYRWHRERHFSDSTMAVSPDGVDLVISDPTDLVDWTRLKGEDRTGLIISLSDWIGRATALTISPDGKWLAGAGLVFQKGFVVAVLDMKTGKVRSSWTYAPKDFRQFYYEGNIAFLDDGTGVVTASIPDGTLRTWKFAPKE